MLNLIRKDIRLQKNGLFILLPGLLLYLFSGFSPTWISIVFCIVIIMDVFSKDENASANLLWNALPYTRKEIVSSKYIGAWVFTFLVLLTIFVGNWMIHREFIQWDQIFLITSIVFLFVSFAFPFAYLFKLKYLINASVVLFVVYFLVVHTFNLNLNDWIRNTVQTIFSLDSTLLYFSIILAIILLYTLSWLLSIRIYSRKVF